MTGTNKHVDRAELIENKKQQIEKILMEEDITFGLAKTIVDALEADFLSDGSTFLNKSALKDVLPFRA